MLLCGDLVTRHLEHRSARSDERDSVVGDGSSEIGVFTEKPVAGVDGVGSRLVCHANDFVNGQVRPNRMTLFTDLVSLVGL